MSGQQDEVGVAKEKDLARAETQESRSRMDREAMPPALKKVGPSRAGPLNNQTQQNNGLSDMSVTRAADRIEYIETAAHYEYLDLVAGGKGEGLTEEELREVVRAFNVKTTLV